MIAIDLPSCDHHSGGLSIRRRCHRHRCHCCCCRQHTVTVSTAAATATAAVTKLRVVRVPSFMPRIFDSLLRDSCHRLKNPPRHFEAGSTTNLDLAP